MTKLKSIISAFRPKTLSAALVPCMAGTALCGFEGGHPSVYIFFYALLSAMCIQVGTNLVNDAMDFKKGADTEERLGPARITQQGVLTYHQVLGLAILFFLGAVLLGLPLVLRGGWVIVGIGVLSVVMGYAYTAGPFPLAYLGLGDLFVILFFGITAVMGIHYLHWGDNYPGIYLPALVLGLQVGFLATVLIAINNLRDMDQDRLAQKKTLAVRFGGRFARIEITMLIVMTFLLNLFWWFYGAKMAALLPLLVIPLGFNLIYKVWTHSSGEIYNRFLAQAALLQILFGVSISIGYYWVL